MTRHTSASGLGSFARVGLAGLLAAGALGATACDKQHEQKAEQAGQADARERTQARS